MGAFQIWIETGAPFRRQTEQKVQRIYDDVIQRLLGAAQEQYHIPLDAIGGEKRPGEPPVRRGATTVLKKLEDAQVFRKLQELGDPEFTQKAGETQLWLQRMGNDQQIGPKASVVDLLKHLFGDDAIETYGKGKFRNLPTPQPAVPQQQTPAPAPAPVQQAPQQPAPNQQMPLQV
jgi:hypothetical protein